MASDTTKHQCDNCQQAVDIKDNTQVLCSKWRGNVLKNNWCRFYLADRPDSVVEKAKRRRIKDYFIAN